MAPNRSPECTCVNQVHAELCLADDGTCVCGRAVHLVGIAGPDRGLPSLAQLDRADVGVSHGEVGEGERFRFSVVLAA